MELTILKKESLSYQKCKLYRRNINPLYNLKILIAINPTLQWIRKKSRNFYVVRDNKFHYCQGFMIFVPQYFVGIDFELIIAVEKTLNLQKFEYLKAFGLFSTIRLSNAKFKIAQ